MRFGFEMVRRGLMALAPYGLAIVLLVVLWSLYLGLGVFIGTCLRPGMPNA